MCARRTCWLEPSVGLVSIAPEAATRMAAQDAMQKLWLHGKAGGLAAREQLKAWALREAWMDGKTGTFGMKMWIAERLTKIGGGRPTSAAVKELLAKIDSDEDWYPGKQYGEKRGRKRVLRGAKALAVARCAQSKKAMGCRSDIRPGLRELQERCYQPIHWQACGQACGVCGLQEALLRRRSRKAITEDVRVKRQEKGSVDVGSSPHRYMVLQQFGMD